MSNRAQKRAIENYRTRFSERGIARFEIQALDADPAIYSGPFPGS